jgi:Mg2+-importing ATPase
LLGYIAFLDPPKETCAAALATLKASGVQVKILTGDNDIITRKICHEVGLDVDRIVLGGEIATLSLDELAELAETAAVLDKVSPSQKAAIIDALHRKACRRFGDGINDGLLRRRRRHISGKRRRHRQGICGHRLAREEPGSAR